MAETPSTNGPTNGPADEPENGMPAAGERPPPGLQVVAQYVKDLSFENANAPRSLIEQGEPPSIQVAANLEARGMPQGMYEVELSMTVTAARGEQRLFLVEVLYAGLFRIRGDNADMLRRICLIDCPRLLFPFVRRIVADATRDGGYTPLLLEPIDFERLYRERQAQEIAAEAGGGA